MKFLSKFALCSFFLVILTVSCASRHEESLAGRWQETGGRETIGFQKDGTFDGRMIWDLNRTPIEVSGTYSVKGDTVTLNMDKPRNLAPMVLRIKFPSNEELTVTFEQGGAIKLDGRVLTYRRIK